jgi:type I restriction enzyme M protein
VVLVREIRRGLLESDLLEGVIALPTDMFYNTGIATYIWILNNRKSDVRQNKVRLVDASGEGFWTSMRRALGSKRRELPDSSVQRIVSLYYGDEQSKHVKDVPSGEFGYRSIAIEQPLIDEQGLPKEKKGKFIADPALRDFEDVPLSRDVDEYLHTEIAPHAPHAWIDHSKTKVGYSINFAKYFYSRPTKRPLHEIEHEISHLFSLLAVATKHPSPENVGQ